MLHDRLLTSRADKLLLTSCPACSCRPAALSCILVCGCSFVPTRVVLALLVGRNLR